MIEQPTTIKPENCSSRMACFYCRSERGERRPAAVRAFSGEAYSGEGYPACAEHASRAITEAMAPLGYRLGVSLAWKVTAYLVEDDGFGFPKLGRKLFTARRKAA